MYSTRHGVATILIVLGVQGLAGNHGPVSQTSVTPVDARYAPLPSYSLVCFPDDRLKTVVTDHGELAYDFGPGPYGKPLTRIGVSLADDTLRVDRQDLEDARVPVVRTSMTGRTGVIRAKAFSWGGAQRARQGDAKSRGWRRLGGENGCVAWAIPPPGTPRALRGVAWGTNRPIQYRVSVPAGESRIVGLGLCESYKGAPKSRLLEVRIEGSASRTIDPIPNGIRNEPVVVLIEASDTNGDGELNVEIYPSPSSPDANVILNAVWIFPRGAEVSTRDILEGAAAAKAELTIECGGEEHLDGVPARLDILTADVQGHRAVPVVQVRSRRQLTFDRGSGLLRGEGNLLVRTVPSPLGARMIPDGLELDLPPGTRRVVAYVGFGEELPDPPFPLQDPAMLEREVKRWWLDSASVLFGRITVPDTSIQYLLDAGVRTIYQVRDRVDGSLQFQPGPSVYRGLWVGDLGIPWIVALMLGDTVGTREYVDVVLSRQRANGQVRVMLPVPALAETPLLIFGVVQHGRATGNLNWLRERFPAITSAVAWIRQMRQHSLEDPRQPYAGLFPPGFIDGGISTPATDYGTVFWALIGLEHAIDAARMLDNQREVREWSALMGDFMNPLHNAMLRDSRPDSGGTLFLPVTVGNTVPAPPQRGMASQVFPAPFGEIYEKDTLLQRTLRGGLLCVDRHQEQGVPVGVGWMADGIWPSWFGTFAAIAHATYGTPQRARELIYAIANHATGAGSWAEEQLPRRMGPGISGDMANAQSAAAFVLAVRWLLARERSNDFEIFASLPPQWLRPGGIIALNQNSGRHGPFSIRCELDSSGATARVHIAAPDGRMSPGRVRILYDSFREAGFSRLNGQPLPAAQVIPWGTAANLELRRD